MTKLKTPKGLKLDKQQTNNILIVGIAIAISIFCLTSTKVLLSNGTYKRHVINARRQAVAQLRQNISQAKTLMDQFQVFEGNNPANIIGGKNTTDQSAVPPDGDNSRIVLDALPSSYDFPALLSSMTKIFSNNQLSGVGISGSDQSDSAVTTASGTPAPIPIPLTINGAGNYSAVLALINDLERSIRPFDITNLQIQGSSSQMTISASLSTYYQPGKTLNITDKAVQ